MSEPWTRQEQINYSTFGKKEGVPEYNEAWKALHRFAKATNCPLGVNVLDHFTLAYARHTAASQSVD